MGADGGSMLTDLMRWMIKVSEPDIASAAAHVSLSSFMQSIRRRGAQSPRFAAWLIHRLEAHPPMQSFRGWPRSVHSVRASTSMEIPVQTDQERRTLLAVGFAWPFTWSDAVLCSAHGHDPAGTSLMTSLWTNPQTNHRRMAWLDQHPRLPVRRSTMKERQPRGLHPR